MTSTVQAVYEHGVFRPLTKLALPEGQQVQVILPPQASPSKPMAASILAEIAGLPVEGGGDAFTSREHDRFLYGAPDQR
jgi:predicted DNA-binding antitoxin AbrB/MazE fold protein